MPEASQHRSPTLSMCVFTRAPADRTRALLSALRPFADELVLAVAAHADLTAARACRSLADVRHVVRTERHEVAAGWLHAACTRDWVLHLQGDEIPSCALLGGIHDALCDTSATHMTVPVRALTPDGAAWGNMRQEIRLILNVPGLARFPGRPDTQPRVIGERHTLELPVYGARDAEVAVAAVPTDDGALIAALRAGRTPKLGAQSTRAMRRVRAAARVTRVGAVVEARELERHLEHRKVGPGAYAARVDFPELVETMAAADRRQIPVRVTNLGDEDWPPGEDGVPPFRLGYRWLDGAETIAEEGWWPFTETVRPGATTFAEVAVRAPDAPGTYQLEIDVVHPGVRWFGCGGRATVDVTAAAPYDAAFFEGHRSGSRAAAERVIPLLLDLGQFDSAVDVGGGTGTWAATCLQRGIGDVLVLDGDWVPEHELDVPTDRFRSTDLAQPITLDRRFDLALCLEVAEHLPESAADTLVRSLTDLAPVVLFSAAIPGQGGTHHVNEQWPAYWGRRFAARGYVCADVVRQHIWDDSDIPWWYRQNMLLYVAAATLNDLPALCDGPCGGELPLSLVHPEALFALTDGRAGSGYDAR